MSIQPNTDRSNPRSKILLVNWFNWPTAILLLVSSVGATVDYSYSLGAMAEPSEAKAARLTVEQHLSSVHGDLAQLQGMLGDTEKLIQGCLADREGTQVPLSNLRSDPFRTNTPAATAASSAAAVVKSDSDRVTLLRDVEKLQLQSVVSSGDHPACMIDNRFYHEGDQIGNFNIERIGDGEVVVRNGEYRFELKIAG